MTINSDAEVIESATSAKDVAESILIWAKKHKLLSKSGVDEAVDLDDFDQQTNPQQMFSAQAVEDILRRRAINLVLYSEPERKVIIYTNGRLNKTETKLLPFTSKTGVHIEYALGGLAQVKDSAPHSDHAFPYTIHQSKYYTCGSSIYPVHCCGAGTLGALVQTKDGQYFGLTNNHVTGACNHAQPGLPILAPGPLDANEESLDPFTIGRHEKLLPINDRIPENIDVAANCDAAIFKISDVARLSSMQGDKYDTPAQVSDPIPGMKVEKVGRTTGFTSGRIKGISPAPIPVHYSVNEYGIRKNVFFTDVFVVEGDNSSLFSKPGDSGSLVVGYDAAGTRIAVGLVFAGNETRGQTFILSLPKIMYNFGLSIVHGHNT